MDFTVEISKAYNVTPFEILRQDKDEVIMLVNYYAEKGQEVTPESKESKGVDNLSEKEVDRQFWAGL